MDDQVDELVEIVERVEKKTGWAFCPKELHDILQFTIRKTDYLMRLVINARGAKNHVRNLSQNAV